MRETKREPLFRLPQSRGARIEQKRKERISLLRKGVDRVVEDALRAIDRDLTAVKKVPIGVKIWEIHTFSALDLVQNFERHLNQAASYIARWNEFREHYNLPLEPEEIPALSSYYRQDYAYQVARGVVRVHPQVVEVAKRVKAIAVERMPSERDVEHWVRNKITSIDDPRFWPMDDILSRVGDLYPEYKKDETKPPA
jgi:hypothetical protein